MLYTFTSAIAVATTARFEINQYVLIQDFRWVFSG